jgi:hypothetical protein
MRNAGWHPVPRATVEFAAGAALEHAPACLKKRDTPESRHWSRMSTTHAGSIGLEGLVAALSSGLAAARALDVIVANQLGGDGDAMAAWEHDRKVERSRRPKTKEVTPTSSVATAAPTVASAP